MEYVAQDIILILAEVREMKMILSTQGNNWTDEQVARFRLDIEHLDKLGLRILGQLIREGKLNQAQYWDACLNWYDCWTHDLPYWGNDEGDFYLERDEEDLLQKYSGTTLDLPF